MDGYRLSVNFRLVDWRRRFGIEVIICLLISLLLVMYVAIFGTSDEEEMLTTSFSSGLQSTGGIITKGRSIGTATLAGVPIYDALQGTGSRLPYQASWGQSLEWPLRFVLGWEPYVLFRVFLITSVFLFISLRSLRSWRPAMGGATLVGISTILVMPSFLYLRQNEWSDQWVQTASISGIAMFLVHRSMFDSLEEAESTRSCTEILAMAVCTAMFVSGHPGLFVCGLLVLLPVFLGLLMTSGRRQLLLNFMRKRIWELGLILVPVFMLVTVIVFDLAAEAGGSPNWTVARRAATQGLYSGEAFVGVTRGLLPTSVERLISVFVSVCVLPLVVLVNQFGLLPNSTEISRLAASMPRGEFAAFGTVLASTHLLLKRRLVSRVERNLAVVVVISLMFVLTIFWMMAEDWLPIALTPSGAFLAFPMLLPLSTLLGVVVWNRRSTFSNILILLSFFQVGLYGLFLSDVMPLSSLRPRFPTQDVWINPSGDESREIARLLGGGERVAMSNRHGLLLGLGVSVVAPATPKIRANAQLVDRTPTEWVWNPLDTSQLSNDALLDFLEVRHVLIPMADSDAEQIITLGKTAENFSLNRLSLRGREYLVRTRTDFSSTIIRAQQQFGNVCPVLEQPCPVVFETLRRAPRAEPRLTTCHNPCLWRYESGVLAAQETLVIPVTYSAALVVRNSGGVRLATVNAAGFLGVTSEMGSTVGTLEITIDPDERMLARVVSSYVSLFSFVILCFLQVYRVRKRSPNVRASRNTSASQ